MLNNKFLKKCIGEERGAAGYRADIDGLRAIAVLSVLIFHSGLALPGGYVGVDVFFVISGFLITRIIDRDVCQRTFSYTDFWVRRIRRLLPAMSAMVLCTIAAGYLILLPYSFKELGQSAVAQSVGLGNFYFWRESGYFAGPSELKPLLHMWSLAVEEQFYFFMPMAMIVSYYFFHKYYYVPLVILGVVSLIISGLASDQYPDMSFYLLPARAWELLIGSGVAFLSQRYHPIGRFASMMGLVGILLVLFSVLVFDQKTVFPGWAALLPCVGTALVIFSNSGKKTFTGEVLSSRLLVSIGLISYSVYLWHWPIFSFESYLRQGDGSVLLSFLLVALSLCLGAVSWKYIEQPLRSDSFWKSKKSVFIGGGVCLGLILTLGCYLHASNGMKDRFSPTTLAMAGARSDRNPYDNNHYNVSIERLSRGLPILTNVASPPCIAVIGDSHANALMPAFYELSEEMQVGVVCATRSATIPLLCASKPAEERFRAEILKQISRIPTLRDVVLVARWNAYGELEFNADSLQRTVDSFEGMGLRVWIVKQVPEPGFDVPRALALATHWNRAMPEGIALQNYEQASYRSSQLFGALKDSVRVVDLGGFFFENTDRSIVSINDNALYVDDDHLSTFGALQLAPILSDIFLYNGTDD